MPRRVARLWDDDRDLADGSMEKRARSCASVSLIRAVMSWEFSKALVKILGGGNLRGDMHDQYAESRQHDGAVLRQL